MCICVKMMGNEIYLPVGAVFKRRYQWLLLREIDEKRFMNVRDFRTFFTEMYVRSFILRYFQKLRIDAEDLDTYLAIRLVGRIWDKFFPDLPYEEQYEQLSAGEVPEFLNDLQKYIYLLLFQSHDLETQEGMIKISNLVMYDILMLLRRDYLLNKEETKKAKILSGEYARSFQTKKIFRKNMFVQ